MNRNIEVISERHWALNFQYVKLGYIQELIEFSNYELEQDLILINDGILLLNTASPTYTITRRLILKLMKRSNDELECSINKMRNLQNRDSHERMYLLVLECELKSRYARQEYLETSSKTTLLAKIKKFIRRRGK